MSFLYTGALAKNRGFSPDFITTWETTTPSETITIPTASNGSYNCVVDWGDGNQDAITTYNDAAWTHTYATAGTHTITISGTFTRIYFNNAGDKAKLRTIENWGDSAWISFYDAFWGCSGLSYVTKNPPNLSACTLLEWVFDQCTSLTELDLSAWDVSTITKMTGLASRMTNLTTLRIANWNTSSLNSMWRMIWSCPLLSNLDISNWDVSGVTTMQEAFNATPALTSLDLSSWNVSNVTSMTSMFGSTAAGLTQANYDALLIAWSQLTLKPNVTFAAGPSKYSAGAAATARANIISTYNWTITDGGQAA